LNLVVGSGPSGVAAALALIERGQEVTLLDVGRELEPELATIPRRLEGLAFEDWPAAEREALARIQGPVVGGYPRKTNFGSDFAYREAPDLMPLEVRDAEILVSLARGGLSNIWGANLFSFCERDLAGWPLEPDSLAAAYRAVLRHLPLSAARGDDLQSLMPLHTEELEPRFLSRQAESLLAGLSRHRAALERRGVRFGPSRLGVRTRASNGRAACVRCGFCLHGCPLDVIYCSSHTLESLREHPRFHYQGGVYVERLAESGRGVELSAVRAVDGARIRFEGSRVFLGCGCYSTTRLLLESLELYGADVIMRESQYFLIPLVMARSFPDAPSERLQTLSQVCLRLRDDAVCAHDVHMLVYTYSHLYRDALERSPVRFVPPLARALLGRLLALQGYLHSEISPSLALSLRKPAAGRPVLEVKGRTHPESRRVVGRIEWRLRSLSGRIGATPIPFMTMVAPPGKSYHGGATFPMARRPGPRESDELGRPMGLSRVHVVDASVFPNIPATNLTLTVMANAYRIAAESAALERSSAPERSSA
jgi:choline dehydrogenase-like flavoprotein